MPLAEQAHHLTRLEVGNDLDFLTDQLLLIWIVFGDTRTGFGGLDRHLRPDGT
jgi:hypothetical protein